LRKKAIGAHHTHSHKERHGAGALKNLRLALGLTFVYMLAEAVGGWFANSLALIADAGHMLTDVAALTLTLAAIWFASRPATAEKTFGYYRLEILAAFVNGVALVLISLWVIYEAFERLNAPPQVKGLELTLVAVGGLIVNLICAYLLHSNQEHDLNLRGAWLHVIGDALGSVAAIVAGVLILSFGWVWADAATSFLISLIIVFSAWHLIRESVNILLEGTPAHINLAAVEAEILQTEGVEGVHDLHIWTISSGIEALSAHVRHGENIVQANLLRNLREKLHECFGIDHLTIQMETPDLEDEDIHFCQTGVNCFEPIQKSRVESPESRVN
jgi:cobalt-zinc-cadmium efflux system protein